jgi:hypothetical protein
MSTENSLSPAAPTPRPSPIPPAHRERPRRKNASARLLTPTELADWYTWLNSHIERKRLLIAQNAMPRASRRLMRARAQASYITRGMRWWDAMTMRERLEALRAADTACPAQAFHYRESMRMRRPVSNVAIMEVSHV